MHIINELVYVGPNRFAHFPVIYLEVDLGRLEQWPSTRLGAAFTDGLLAALPGLCEHGCSYGEPGGFVRRLTRDSGTWMGHILEHVAIELQNVAGIPVTFGKTRSLESSGHYYVVYQYVQAEVGLEAGRLALRLLQSLLPERVRWQFPAPFDFAAERDGFIRLAQRLSLGPSTLALVQAAERRGIPWMRLNASSLIQLGQGRFQTRLEATITGRSSHIAVELASDKEATNRLLANQGLPVPSQILVESEEEAAAAAERLGYPVAIKPLGANHGKGVSLDVQHLDQVGAAFAHARAHGSAVILENQVAGADHRLVVVNGRLVAAAKRIPGHVVGDGIHTIEELVAMLNADPRRGIGHEKVLTRLEPDDQAEHLLARKGYRWTSVPPAGETVFLRLTANLSTGGTATDVTDIVHPDNCEMAVRAARVIGLDVAGVDFITPDISRSYKEVGGAICELNAAPGFRMHLSPAEGQPRDVAGAVIDMLFPPGSPCTIPIAAITGTNGKTTTARMLAHICRMAGHHVGLTTTDGVYIDGQRTVEGDMTGPVATRMVLRDPTVDMAVLEIARGGLLRSGMGVPYCDVGAVLNVQSDHLGLGGVRTVEALAEVKRIVVEVARDTAVLNADDPLCWAMAAHTDAKVVCYLTRDPSHSLVRAHILRGGRAVVLEHGISGPMITLYEHTSQIPLVGAHLIPATFHGRAVHNIENAMFAAAMGFSLGVRLEDIRSGLLTFDATFFQTPGRTNVFGDLPFKMILDYGHNPAAVEAMVGFVNRLDATGRRVVVLASPGDRRDEDVRQIGRVAAGAFDLYICRRDDQLRGRTPEDIPRLLREGLIERGVHPDQIRSVPEEEAAVALALEEARPGDLILIFADDVTRGWRQITESPAGKRVSGFERRRQPRPKQTGPRREPDRRAVVRESRTPRLSREAEQSD